MYYNLISTVVVFVTKDSVAPEEHVHKNYKILFNCIYTRRYQFLEQKNCFWRAPMYKKANKNCTKKWERINQK